MVQPPPPLSTPTPTHRCPFPPSSAAHRRTYRAAARQQATYGVPADVWRTLALAALVAEGDSLAAWLRLSLVSRTWRDSLSGAYRPAAR